MNKRVKYIHILYRNELKFNGELIRFFNDPATGFVSDEHLFVSLYKNQYENLKKYNNVIYDPNTINYINKYGKKGSWIIAHSVNSVFQLLFARDKYLKKTVFRYWGGGISNCNLVEGELLKNFVKLLIHKRYLYKLSLVKAIGIANIIDEIEIKNVEEIRSVDLFQLSYASAKMVEARTDIYHKMLNKIRDSDCINIMVGHRGGREGDHIFVLELLKKFIHENINIYLPISYGDSDYIKEIEEYVNLQDNNKIHLIDYFMDYSRYCEFLSEIDIGIFAGKNSYALGNIQVLLYFKKKIFLNENGIIKKAFDYERTPYCTINDIDDMTYEDFISPIEYPDGVTEKLQAQDMSSCINHWIDLFKFLENDRSSKETSYEKSRG